MNKKTNPPQLAPRSKHNHPKRIPDEKRIQIAVEAACTTASQRQIAKKHGITQQAVSKIAHENRALLQEVLKQRSAEAAELTWTKFVEIVQAITPEKISEATLRDLAVAAGIMFDKYALATGQPTAREEVSLAELNRELFALLREAKEQGLNLGELLSEEEYAEYEESLAEGEPEGLESGNREDGAETDAQKREQ